SVRFLFSPQRLVPVTWTYPATNRLLFEAGGAYRVEGILSEPWIEGDRGILSRSVVETTINRMYGSDFGSLGPTEFQAQTNNHQWISRASMSYVTGSHAIKVGGTTFTRWELVDPSPNFPEQYSFRNQAPLSITQVAVPANQENELTTIGLF